MQDPHSIPSPRPRALATAMTTPGVPVPVLDEPTVQPRAAPSRDCADTIRPGARIGRYVVHRKLGRGGMGVVYGASDPELERRVAIKLVRGRSHCERFSTRLRREAQALARLLHPNIVALYDVGTAPQGTFMAMEYLPGLDLARWLAARERGWAEIIDVFVEAGRGLAAAHAAGLVHRDFKPTNVMVCTDGRIKVLDFGLAFGTPTLDPWLSSTGGDGSLLSRRLTRNDVVLGTAGYMSPEALMSHAPVGPRADQFSFCVALFEALHGVRPYPGRNPIEMASAFAEGQLRQPSRTRGLPRRIERAVLRGLALEPDARFPNMDALLQALRPTPYRRWPAIARAGAIVCAAGLSAVTTIAVSRWTTPAASACTSDPAVTLTRAP
jgi:eukaryotic-like serine/threonine-protein kinase